MGKKRIALVIGYIGTRYKGSQINGEEETVEKVLCKEIGRLGYFKEQNTEDYSKVGLQRSSRTDKGVHAAMMVVSVRVEVGDGRSVEGLESALRERLLEHEITLHRILTVTKGFDAKNRCESRVYEYFVPQSVCVKENQGSDGRSDKRRGGSRDEIRDDRREGEADVCEESEKRHRIFKKSLQKMVGTHDFHNFTVAAQEKGPKRFIKYVEVERMEVCGREWSRATIHGQSFMIHQIRKMIGFAVLLAREIGDEKQAEELVEKAFKKEKRNVPKAPGALLILSHGVFPNYNERFGKTHGNIENEGSEGYKKEKLYPVVCTEENVQLFATWCETIEKHKEEFQYIHKEDEKIADLE